METNLKRNKDGTIKGITTMGDSIRTETQVTERDKKKAEYEKQWNKKHPR